jgi:hypothetical protein
LLFEVSAIDARAFTAGWLTLGFARLSRRLSRFAVRVVWIRSGYYADWSNRRRTGISDRGTGHHTTRLVELPVRASFQTRVTVPT